MFVSKKKDTKIMIFSLILSLLQQIYLCCVKSSHLAISWIHRYCDPFRSRPQTQLLDCLFIACKEFILIISLPIIKKLTQDSSSEPSIKINYYELGFIEDFPYLSTNISESLSLDSELNGRIWKAAGTLSKITDQV